jgi:hypothetical protein
MLIVFKSVHVNRKYSFGDTASGASIILKP